MKKQHIHNYISEGGKRQLQQIKWFLFKLKQPDFIDESTLPIWEMTREGNIQTALNFVKMSGIRLPLISKKALYGDEPTTWDHVYSNTSVTRWLVNQADKGLIDEAWVDNNLVNYIPTIKVTRRQNALLGDWIKRQYDGDFNRILNLEHYKYWDITLAEMPESMIGRKTMYPDHITESMTSLITPGRDYKDY